MRNSTAKVINRYASKSGLKSKQIKRTFRLIPRPLRHAFLKQIGKE